MRGAKSFFIFIFVGLFTFSAQAQLPELIKKQAFREDARAAVDSLYNFNAVAADEQLASWQKKYPNHPLWKLFDAMSYWWLVLSDLESKAYDEHMLQLMKEADYEASKLLNKRSGHVDGLIVKAIANGYMARYNANRGEWVTSIQYGRTAMEAFKYLQQVMPDLPDLKFAQGLKKYYLAYLPKAYPVVKTVTWALPDGNSEKGITMLKKAAEQAIFADAEAAYFLGNIYFNYEHQPENAVHYFRQLYKKYPNNNYYARLLVHSYYRVGMYHKALQFIDHTLKRWEQQNLPFGRILKQELYYWKGRVAMRRRYYKKAVRYFRKSIQQAESLSRTKYRGYYTAAAFYAGESLLQRNNVTKAIEYFKKATRSKAGEGYKKMAKDKLDQLDSK